MKDFTLRCAENEHQTYRDEGPADFYSRMVVGTDGKEVHAFNYGLGDSWPVQPVEGKKRPIPARTATLSDTNCPRGMEFNKWEAYVLQEVSWHMVLPAGPEAQVEARQLVDRGVWELYIGGEKAVSPVLATDEFLAYQRFACRGIDSGSAGQGRHEFEVLPSRCQTSRRILCAAASAHTGHAYRHRVPARVPQVQGNHMSSTEWTSTKPTVSGWYWMEYKFSNGELSHPEIVYVRPEAGKLVLDRTAISASCDLRTGVHDAKSCTGLDLNFCALWYGPLPQPERRREIG